mmetsp:Transcript_9598/g.19956  ORF Transcript_9598/g.19956 Transcript_9598/m.19956 type:complete len:163 (-) Transcript_9598:357-845(-)|eukprot:CAMPEP_0172456812 /NCGR_PEP_ID=MMETSP1065-20121228/17722_1 /TAXON_ID=265537 /ORGANISM="Amphiprora paludosa, Strain CCMP125" /LENGTH=162 /DNA_ID=CAMNT_0013210057 /DNA_START=100 /DNA_END=588 /DNA_ORIENTATION=+
MTQSTLFSLALCLLSMGSTHGYAFVSSSTRQSTFGPVSVAPSTSQSMSPSSSSTSLQMVDSNVIQGAGIAVAGLVAGVGLVAFTEQQGERAKERGSGLSSNMSTKIAGQLLEDVEVSSVSDLGGLTAQLEQALKETGQTKEEDMVMTEEEKQRIAEEADDGW